MAPAVSQRLSSVSELSFSSLRRGRNVGGARTFPAFVNISGLSMSKGLSVECGARQSCIENFRVSQGSRVSKVFETKWTSTCAGEGVQAQTEEEEAEAEGVVLAMTEAEAEGVVLAMIEAEGEGVVLAMTEAEAEAEGVVPAMTEAEQAGWEQRQKEAAEVKDAADPFQWRWTLNWNAITPNIIVGSCPRSPGDIDRMVDEAGIDAVLNLQSGLCFDALKIPFEAVRKRAVERGIRLERVEIRDFDHADQSLMLPVAVRVLNSLLARGMRVYVHCTAGINRATLTTVGHLTFVQQMDLEEAVTLVKSARPVAHPYIDCWTEVRRRLLDGRREEVTRISESIYESRVANKSEGTKLGDWVVAEKRVISNTFQRYLETDLAMLDMETAWLKRRFELEHKTGGNGSAQH